MQVHWKYLHRDGQHKMQWFWELKLRFPFAGKRKFRNSGIETTHLQILLLSHYHLLYYFRRMYRIKRIPYYNSI